MAYILLGAVNIIAVYFCVRYLLQRKALRDAAQELHEITEDLELNRVVKLSSPHKDLEIFLAEVNRNLSATQKARILYESKEKELQKQIEDISHDLRTPLTAMLGFINMIDRESLSGEDRESLQVIEKKAQTLKKLITEFYDLSRLAADDYKLELKQIEFGRKVREMALEYYTELKNRKLDVKLDIPDIPVFVRGDDDALERILSNLLQNAARYAYSTFHIQLKTEGERAIVLLENDTEYLSPEEGASLFKRFYTADNSRSQGSTGLGLSIARYLAEKMDGELYAEVTEPGPVRWLKIYLKLPRR